MNRVPGTDGQSLSRWQGLAGAILLFPLALYTHSHFQRPAHTTLTNTLAPGITYERFTRQDPRIHVVHVVQVDLTDPSLDIVITPGDPGVTADGVILETVARTTSEFVREFDLHVAANAGFFFPFSEKTPWNYYPHSGDGVNVLGQGIVNGQEYSPSQEQWGVLCFAPDRSAQILVSGICPEETMGAVAGRYVLTPTQRRVELQGDRAYARTLVALDEAGQTLWLVVVDGKQPYYSEGILINEAEDLILDIGATQALNLDGGGSTTLVAGPAADPQILNAPIHAKWPMYERSVATHLGFAIRSQ